MDSLSFEKRFVLASGIFIASGVAALVLEQAAYLLVPALWLVLSVGNIFHPRYLFLGLLVTLPLSTELNITPSLGLDFPDEPLMIGLTALFIFSCAYNRNSFPSTVYKHWLFMLIVLHLLWVFITCLYSEQVLLSFKFLAAKVWYIIPFVVLPSVLVNSKNAIRIAALSMLIPMTVIVIVVIARHSFYGFSFEGVKHNVSPFFRNHVNYSAMLVCMLAIGFTTFVLTTKHNWFKKLIALLLVVGVVATYLSYSRGAWVALIVGLASWWFIRKKLIGSLIIIIVATTFITLAWLVKENHYLAYAPDFTKTIFHTELKEHLQATIRLKDVSNAERFYRWIAGINMIAHKPVTGFGPNTFTHYYKSYTALPFVTWVSNNPEHSTIHNYFLLTAVEQGIPGLIIFCMLYFSMILYSQRLFHQLKDNFYRHVALCCGVILVMIGCLIFMSDLIETDKIGSLFWLCAGLLIVISNKRNEEMNAV